MLLVLAACVPPNQGGFGGGGSSTGAGPIGGSPVDTAEDSSVDSGGETGLETGDPDLDSDGDGFSDVDERAAGSDPTACWSVPSGWPQCLHEAEGVEGQGWRLGYTAPNWSAPDQHGGELQFHQLYGMVVVVDISSGWCPPCREAALAAEDFYAEHRDDGVILLHLMVEDLYGDPAAQPFLEDWAEQYGLSFPVLADDADVYEALYAEGYIQGIPAYFVYDRELVLQEGWSGHSAEYMNEAVARYK